jgi:MoaD family protein
VKVRLFAALRDLAGTSELDEEAADVGALLDRLRERFGPDFARIAAAGSVIVGDERAKPDRPLEPSDEVAILPPVSGGDR